MEFKHLKDGMKLLYNNNGENFPCAIRVVDGKKYICSDRMSGNDCGPEKYGYRYSYYIGTEGVYDGTYDYRIRRLIPSEREWDEESNYG